jgi:SAM-dependent methyltransferase
MVVRTNRVWQAFGRTDPLWGVATWRGRDRRGSNPWTDDDFYALGNADWLAFKATWPNRPSGTILEIGCGAGRMTRMLACDFTRVIAVDVSADAIAYGRRRVTNENIEWREGDGTRLPMMDGGTNAVFSCHVFQHFPDNLSQVAMFAEIFRVLQPGGTFLIHIPMHRFPTGRVGSVMDRAYGFWSWMRPTPLMHMTSYAYDALFTDLALIGFTNIAITAVSCITGRKP